MKKVVFTKKTRGQAAFSLIELLIVVAIILIIAAIAIPKLLAAKGASQESAGAGTTRTMASAIAAYQTHWNTFPATAGAMGGAACATTAPTLTAGCTLDDTLAQAIGATPIGAYNFTYTQVGSGSDFTLNVDPVPGASYVFKHYFVNSDLSVHVNATAPAGPTDPTL